MARYDLSFRTIQNGSGTPAAEVRSTSCDRPRVLEIGMLQTTSSGIVMGIGVPAAIGIGPSGAMKMLPEDVSDPSAAVTVATAWNVMPTAPNAFYRRVGAVANAGTGLIIGFPRGLAIALSSSIVLWNLNANNFLDCWVTIGE